MGGRAAATARRAPAPRLPASTACSRSSPTGSTTSSSTPPARSSRWSATSRSASTTSTCRPLTRRRIPAGNTPGVLTETTADLAFALLMAAARRIPESVDYVREGRWRTWGPMLLMGVDIHGATLGIVGFGRIGREMARRGRGFGMNVLYHDVHPATPEEEAELGARRVEMDELLRESDFISLHVNLTDETHHLIDADALRAMKPTAVLVNTSRGPVVDPAALRGRRCATARSSRPASTSPSRSRCRPTTRWSRCRTASWCRTSPRPRASRATGWPRWRPPICWPACAASDFRRRSTPRSTTSVPDTRLKLPDLSQPHRYEHRAATASVAPAEAAHAAAEPQRAARPVPLPLRRGRAGRDPGDPGHPVRHRLPVRGRALAIAVRPGRSRPGSPRPRP